MYPFLHHDALIQKYLVFLSVRKHNTKARGDDVTITSFRRPFLGPTLVFSKVNKSAMKNYYSTEKCGPDMIESQIKTNLTFYKVDI